MTATDKVLDAIAAAPCVEPDERNQGHGYQVHPMCALAAIRALALTDPDAVAEAIGMERADPFETFTAGDGMPAIRGRTDLFAFPTTTKDADDVQD